MRRPGPAHGHTVSFEWESPEGVSLEILAEFDAGDPSVGLYPAWFMRTASVGHLTFGRDAFMLAYGYRELTRVEDFVLDLVEGLADDARAEAQGARNEDDEERGGL